MRAKLLSVLILVGFLAGVFFVAAAPARAAFSSLDLKPGLYTGGSAYVPGETLEWTIVADPGDVYDVMVTYCATAWSPFCTGRLVLRLFNDQTVPASGQIVLSYDIPLDLPDSIGPARYYVEVHNENWQEPGIGNTFDRAPFSVRGYDFTIGTDRGSYLPGDTVRVVWSANNVRDGTLAPDGVGQIWVFNNADTPLISPNPYTFSASSGSFSFDLSVLSDPNIDAVAFGWFNNTVSNPDRTQYDQNDFDIDFLGVIVDVAPGIVPNIYEPGGIVTVLVTAKITDSQANPQPWNPGAPGVSVDIEVRDQTSGLRVSAYEVSGLLTDSQGRVTHVFQLATTILDGTDFEVFASATAHGVINWGDTDTFTVRSVGGISVVMTFDKSQYASGDVMKVVAQVIAGAGGTYTYQWLAGDPTSGVLLDVVTTSSYNYTYAIPETFTGDLTIVVTVDDGQGNRASASRSFTIQFGWLLVNLDRFQYNPGETVTATWDLRSNVIDKGAAAYFYEIFDASSTLAASGTAAGLSVSYTTPSVPSSSYRFEITAIQAGRSVTGSATAFQVSGYFLSISFDRPSYAPGETMRITYTVIARGQSVLPSVFFLGYYALGAPLRSAAVGTASGVVEYRVPEGMNEGNTLFIMGESTTGATAYEIVTIRGTNPLWFTTLADIPVFDWILLFLVLILIIAFWMKFRGPGLAAARPKPEAPEGAEKPSPPVAEPSAAGPMTVSCKACGAPIEITTSKRPIEVMCPSCGETAMVE